MVFAEPIVRAIRSILFPERRSWGLPENDDGSKPLLAATWRGRLGTPIS